MSDDSSQATPAWLKAVWAALNDDGYALTSDEAIGLPPKFRENFAGTYFNDRRLHHDEGDYPVDRKRARDVIRYQWRDDGLLVREHETITITDRAGIPGKRDHSRIMLLEDPEAERLIRTFLCLVPPPRRHRGGTFGLNLFRTHSNVVSKPHHDDEHFVIIYVLDRVGDGAETRLYQPGHVNGQGKPTAEPTFRHQLNPGEIVIFDDERFKHETTELVALSGDAGGAMRRDALVCTVDSPDTYLAVSA